MRAACWPGFLLGALVLLLASPSTGQPTRRPSPSQVRPGQPSVPPQTDRQLVEQAHLKPEGPELLEYLREHAAARPEEERITRSLRALADTQPEARNTAFAELVCQGTVAIPALRRVANDLEHPDIAEQARQVLAYMEGKAAANLSAAVVRCVSQQRPEGSVEALFAFRPFAEDEVVGQEVDRAILALSMHAGKVDAAAVRALEDAVPVRRAAAAMALCQPGAEKELPAVRKLLRDPVALVRLRAAVGLATLNEAEAVPVLIDLLAELPLAQRLEAQQALTHLAGEWALGVPQGEDDVARRLRRDAWASWWRAIDGPTLLNELRKRTPSDTDRARARVLIHQLVDGTPATRDAAVLELSALSPAAAALLYQAADDPDPRLRGAVAECLQALDGTISPPLPGVVLRLLAMKKPDGATEALLAFLPSVESPRLLEQVEDTLAAVALRDGKAVPTLLRVLQDPVSIRRAAAGELLASRATPEYRAEVRRLLRDPDPNVRLPIALLLASKGDREAIPPLIDLLEDFPQEYAAQAAEFLLRLAGGQAPAVSSSDDPAARHRCRDAWAKWWSEQGPKLDLEHLENPRWLFGYTLVVDQYESVLRSGRVLELDARGRVCWEIDGLQQPLDAQFLSPGRVLILEQGGFRLVERALNGTILREKAFSTPAISFRRFADGTTGLVFRDRIEVLDAKGAEKVLVRRSAADISQGSFLADRSLTLVTTSHAYERLDDRGKSRGSHRLSVAVTLPPNWDFPAAGHILAPQNRDNKVVEIDCSGNVVWEAAVARPEFATRTSTGHTLVASLDEQKVVELDRTGRIVKEQAFGLRPWRVHRR